MSLRIIRPGILDTLQDQGRWGKQHLGINPGGAMDRFSSRLANALLGKDLHSPVLEIHFPAPQIRFEKAGIICLAGADFCPTLNGRELPLHHPVAVKEQGLLKFEKIQSGARCYLALWQDLVADHWMESYSTHLKVGAGGWKGRALVKNDLIPFTEAVLPSGLFTGRDLVILPWKSQETVDTRHEIRFLLGNEWHWISREAQENFKNSWFQITLEADRMGYHLAGPELEREGGEQLVSSPVCFGTVQLLPNGQLIILMADHQTTGGYPRVAQVVSAHLPLLAQKKANDVIQFVQGDMESAEAKILAQQKYLEQLQLASRFRMAEWLASVTKD
ncbi:MAG: 5-oxoprolinase subunit C family protein [Flavisolibacter sp.]